MKEEKFPARLHVLIASKSDKAIVIRRGPSKHTCVFSWDRTKNTFEVAQWLKGRIYERRSDICPSGKYWIYFAMNGKWGSETKGAWTAISKTPWLKAITLFSKGDCWNGGGLFLDDKTYWLNNGYGHELLLNSTEVKMHETYVPSKQYGGECLHVYFNRLQRDGWIMMNPSEYGKTSWDAIFEKELPNNWLLRKICHHGSNSRKGKGCYWDKHELQNQNGEVLPKPDWGWAELVDSSIIFAENGALYKITTKNPFELGELKSLHDFNNYKFENRQAPY